MISHAIHVHAAENNLKIRAQVLMSGNIYQNIIRKLCMIDNKNVLPTYRNMISKYEKSAKIVINHHVIVKCDVLEQKMLFSKEVLNIRCNSCEA